MNAAQAVFSARLAKATAICAVIADRAGLTVPGLLRKHSCPRGNPELARLQRQAYEAMVDAGLPVQFIATFAGRDRGTIYQVTHGRRDRARVNARGFTLEKATKALMQLAADAGLEVEG